jgi:hypothetical protein
LYQTPEATVGMGMLQLTMVAVAVVVKQLR